MSIDDLTPAQKFIASEFLAALLAGKSVTYLDFPGVSQAEFEAVADAVTLIAGFRH